MKDRELNVENVEVLQFFEPTPDVDFSFRTNHVNGRRGAIRYGGVQHKDGTLLAILQSGA
jgi:hypothetical protein